MYFCKFTEDSTEVGQKAHAYDETEILCTHAFLKIKRYRLLFAAVYLASLAVLVAGPALAADPNTEPVGRSGDRLVTPVNQIVTPAGRQVDLPGLRPQALALSPDGKLLAVSGKTSEVLILNPVSGEIRQRVSLPPDATGEIQSAVASTNLLKPDHEGQVSFTGLVFSHDGRKLFMSNVEGNIKVF